MLTTREIEDKCFKRCFGVLSGDPYRMFSREAFTFTSDMLRYIVEMTLEEAEKHLDQTSTKETE